MLFRSTVLALFLLSLTTSPALGQDAVVVTTDDLRPALVDWLAHRKIQGRHVAIAAPGDDVRATVRALHEKSEGALEYVLLLGDVDRVPCVYRNADAISRWEKDPRIATDAPLADVDDDGLPDLAIGRITAKNVDEARAILARSIAYETTPRAGSWRRRLGVVAGVGGFGVQADMSLELLTRLVLNNDVPVGAETHFVYAKETSAFCPPPPKLQEQMLGLFADGALVVAYVGHGSARHVDRMTWNDAHYPILEAAAAETVDCREGPPLTIFIACTTGRYDGDDDSLAEILLAREHGPPAVIASSRVSTPYGNGILAVELLHGVFETEGPITTGMVLRDAKRRLAGPVGDSRTRKTLEAMAGSFYEPDPERRAVDRREHVLLYQLFGDPLLRLARPERAIVAPPSTLTAGEDARIVVTSPVAGKARLELLPRRDAHAQPRRSGRSAVQMAEEFERANVRPVASLQFDLGIAGEASTATLPVPEGLAAGRYHVRVWIEAGTAVAAGGAVVRVRARR